MDHQVLQLVACPLPILLLHLDILGRLTSLTGISEGSENPHLSWPTSPEDSISAVRKSIRIPLCSGLNSSLTYEVNKVPASRVSLRFSHPSLTSLMNFVSSLSTRSIFSSLFLMMNLGGSTDTLVKYPRWMLLEKLQRV